MHALEENYKAIQTENYSLREYIIHLQSRLIESHGEFPQPPPNVNLSHPAPQHHTGLGALGGRPLGMGSLGQSSGMASSSTMGNEMGSETMSQLQASAAQAVADLRESVQGKQHENRPYKDESRPTDIEGELGRQLQASTDGLPMSGL
jgi:hypothetical protein